MCVYQLTFSQLLLLLLLTWEKIHNWLKWKVCYVIWSNSLSCYRKMGLNRSSLALWSKTGGREVGVRLLHLVLTCFFLHQPDIHWLGSLQLVNGKTNLNNTKIGLSRFILNLSHLKCHLSANRVNCLHSYNNLAQKVFKLTSSSVTWGDRPQSMIVLLFLSSPGSLL